MHGHGGGRELRGEEVNVRLGGAQGEEHVGALHVLAHGVAGHGAGVHPSADGAAFLQGSLAVARGRHGDAEHASQPPDAGLGVAPVHLHAGEERRALRAGQRGDYLRHGLRTGLLVVRGAHVPGGRPSRGRRARRGRHIHRQFDEHRAAVAHAQAQGLVDELRGLLGIQEHHRCPRDGLEGRLLRVQLRAHGVVRERVGGRVRDIVPRRGRPADDHEGHGLGEGPGAGVEHGEASDTVGDARAADPVGARVRVGRVACVQLIAGANPADAAVYEHVAEAQGVVPRDAEYVAHAHLLEACGEVGAH
mmetsp:Transcript_25235/g.84570  ORF Transcript_25235/g.84570 Transcript_25235/m.84570 type:complete len:305 (-) Transcript_25235:79-993(-)